MTDNDIIKALEEELKTALIINHRFEESNDTENPDDHKFIALLINTIKLINRQKEEIERLEETKNRLSYNLQAVLDERADHSEAVKEFAERLNDYVFEAEASDDPQLKVRLLFADDIEKAKKEMVGESK